MLGSTVDDVGLSDPCGDGVEAALDLWNHSPDEDAAFAQARDARGGERRNQVLFPVLHAFDVGHEDELFGLERCSHVSGDRVRVHVERTPVFVDRDGGDHRNEASIDELSEHVGVHGSDVAHAAWVNLDALFRLHERNARAAEEVRVLAREADGSAAVLRDERDDFLVELAAEDHFHDLHGAVVRHTQPVDAFAHNAHGGEHGVDLRAAPMNHDRVEADVLQKSDIPGKTIAQRGVDHRVTAVLDDEGLPVEAAYVGERLLKDVRFFDELAHDASGVPRAGAREKRSLGMSATEEKSWASVAVEKRGAVALVTLTGPGKGNAMGPEFWAEMPEVMATLNRDRSVRACVLRGSGKCFTVGLDLMRTMGELSPMLTGAQLADQRRELLALIERYQRGITAVAEARMPVVAAVHSYCLGGGLDLIAASDVRVASSDAVFSVREVRIAIVADVGSLQRLPGIVGEGRTREWALTGRDFDANEALRTGLVTSVHDGGADGVLAAALAIAERIAANSPIAVEGVKAVMNDARASREREDLRRVALWNTAFLSSTDLQEAFMAFAERREPVFK